LSPDSGKPFVSSTPVGRPYSLKHRKTKKTASDSGVIHVYEDILVESNPWIELACAEAVRSVETGGGPFGAVLLQIDDKSNEVIRYWKDNNHVVEHSDPTAHAEISVIRAACHELGVHDLGRIERAQSKMPQRGETSHCEIYASCEPCPMCYAAIYWARIPVLVFSATCLDASEEGVGFSDAEIYDDIKEEHKDRSIRVYQAVCDGTLDAFMSWKKSENRKY
jgi:tRNA(Arg) A34 adenosine deaminase TadA